MTRTSHCNGPAVGACHVSRADRNRHDCCWYRWICAFARYRCFIDHDVDDRI